MTCTLKTLRHWWKKSKMIQIDGKLYHARGLEDFILSTWLYFLRQATESMQSPSTDQGHFSQNLNKILWSWFGSTKAPEEPKTSCKREMELQQSGSLNSDSTTKQQSSKPHAASTETDMYISGTGWKAQKETPLAPTANSSVWQRRPDYAVDKRPPDQEGVPGRRDSRMEKNEMRTLPNTRHKNKLPMD